jgi:aromatic-L-amino-acid decarboxylase
MEDHDAERPNETLDPDDWPALRQLGHQMIDDTMDYLENVRLRPVWQPIPSSVKTFLKQPLPRESQGEESVYREFVDNILPHPMGNIHPRFWGWVIGTGTPFGMLAEMLAACMNPNLGGADHVANYVETQVLDWCKEMLAYPADASGLLVSGCSMANLVGLTVARNAKAEGDLRRDGLRALPRDMVLYGSEEMHSSIQKAVELLGLGSNALREIPVNDDFQIDIAALQTTIIRDRERGFHPFCVVANVGTVNTGAIDDLNGLADICEAENIWFHVDGAFGALASLAPLRRHLVEGLTRADSLAFDLHKWMSMPLEIGCVLVRSEAAHRGAFAVTTHYLDHGGDRGMIADSLWFSEYGVQLSRGFRALKAWMSMKAYGIEKYGRMIEKNIAQATYLSERVDAHPELERCAPVPLNIVCFRYIAAALNDVALNALNRELLIRLHESGAAVPSYTSLAGRYVLRVAITNHRSRREDFDFLVEEVVRLGRELKDQMVCEPTMEDKIPACWFGSPS